MIKTIKEINSNPYSIGHEQHNKRPYLIVHEGYDYILGFPTTTKLKSYKKYLSHINPKITSGLGFTVEVMIDQLQLINFDNFTPRTGNVIQDCQYDTVIDSFISQIIKPEEKVKKQIKGCPSFYDVISFYHNIPQFHNIDKWLVVSSKHFNITSGICFIVPSDSFNFSYMHSIDWQAREFSICGNLAYEETDILNLQDKIKQTLI